MEPHRLVSRAVHSKAYSRGYVRGFQNTFPSRNYFTITGSQVPVGRRSARHPVAKRSVHVCTVNTSIPSLSLPLSGAPERSSDYAIRDTRRREWSPRRTEEKSA